MTARAEYLPSVDVTAPCPSVPPHHPVVSAVATEVRHCSSCSHQPAAALAVLRSFPAAGPGRATVGRWWHQAAGPGISSSPRKLPPARPGPGDNTEQTF